MQPNFKSYVVFLVISFSQQSCAQIDDGISTRTKEACPCILIEICPRPYGLNGSDIEVFGKLSNCTKDDETRCCGAIVSATQTTELTEGTLEESTTLPFSSTTPSLKSRKLTKRRKLVRKIKTTTSRTSTTEKEPEEIIKEKIRESIDELYRESTSTKASLTTIETIGTINASMSTTSNPISNQRKLKSQPKLSPEENSMEEIVSSSISPTKNTESKTFRGNIKFQHSSIHNPFDLFYASLLRKNAVRGQEKDVRTEQMRRVTTTTTTTPMPTPILVQAIDPLKIDSRMWGTPISSNLGSQKSLVVAQPPLIVAPQSPIPGQFVNDLFSLYQVYA